MEPFSAVKRVLAAYDWIFHPLPVREAEARHLRAAIFATDLRAHGTSSFPLRNSPTGGNP